jgi:hypothetical protein
MPTKFSLTVVDFKGAVLLEGNRVTLRASQGYVIRDDLEGRSITCLACGRTSHNTHDVQHRYCGHCHVFHEDPPA